MPKNELGAKVLELIPETLREDLIEEIMNQLIESGAVTAMPKKPELTPDQQKASISKLVDQLMPSHKKS